MKKRRKKHSSDKKPVIEMTKEKKLLSFFLKQGTGVILVESESHLG